MDPPKRPPASQETLLESGEKAKKRKKAEGQPRRPLSAYNYFFKAERIRLLQEIEQRGEETVAREAKVGSVGNALANSKESHNRNKRRGGAKFHIMGKIIGRRWQALQPEERAQYEKAADVDMKRYREEMDAYNEAMVRNSSLFKAAIERGALTGGQSLPVSLRKSGQASSERTLSAEENAPKKAPQEMLPTNSGDAAAVEASLLPANPSESVDPMPSSVLLAPNIPVAPQQPGPALQSGLAGLPQSQLLSSSLQIQPGYPEGVGVVSALPQSNLEFVRQLLLLRTQQAPPQPASQSHAVAPAAPGQVLLQQENAFGRGAAPSISTLLSQLNPTAASAGLAPPGISNVFGGPSSLQQLNLSLPRHDPIASLFQQVQQQGQGQEQQLQPESSGSVGVPSPTGSSTTPLQQHIEQLLRSYRQNRDRDESKVDSSTTDLLGSQRERENANMPPPP